LTDFILRPAAVGDLREAYAWYEKERAGLGQEFLREVRATLDRVLDQPRAYPVIHRDTRRAIVRRFPYALFYRRMDDLTVFVACYHMRRDPKGWQRRR